VLPPAGLAIEEQIHVRNRTNVQLFVTINGAPGGTVPAATDGVVPLRGRGMPPYRVELRTPSGRVALEFRISQDEYRRVADEQGGSGSGTAVECGWLEIAYGAASFSEPAPDAVMPTPGGVCP